MQCGHKRRSLPNSNEARARDRRHFDPVIVSNDPPFLILHGRGDEDVSLSTSELVHDALAKHLAVLCHWLVSRAIAGSTWAGNAPSDAELLQCFPQLLKAARASGRLPSSSRMPA
jgi:hypothetical protein